MEINFNLESDIQKLIDCDALEIYFKGKNIFIPYMMSDAVECYIKFEDCSVQGKWDADYVGETSVTIAKNNDRQALILHQGYDNVVTIWFHKVVKYLELYQYHRIAHIWVRGNEKWRRLVYIVGTIHDKISFLGVEYSTKEECNIVNLMGFAPFRYWTPIHESLDDYYANTRDGIMEILDIAVRLGDEKFISKLQRYANDFALGKLTPRKIRHMARAVAKNNMLYAYLNSMIEMASSTYSIREYTEPQKMELERLRVEAVKEFTNKGYSGTYPLMNKGKKRVTFYEEHPYIMQEFEYENFGFKVNPIEE